MSDFILLFILFTGTLYLNKDTIRRDWSQWQEEE